MAEQIVKKKPRGKAFVKGQDDRRNTTPAIQEGAVQTYGQFFLEAWDLPKIDCNDINQVEDRTYLYFSKCIENDMKPGVAGLCYFLGIDRRTFYAWSQGINRSGDRRYIDLCKKASDFLEALMEEYMQNGKINPVSGIFLLKNHFGYRDTQEVLMKGEDPLEKGDSVEQVRERYKNAVVEDQ